MKTRAGAVSLIVATLLVGAPPFAPRAEAQQAAPSQLNDHMLPMAVGALAGAFATFFVLPLIIPATAVAATAGASTTASPVLAVVGAGVGSFLGYEMAPTPTPPR
jgi:hypothetical protein